MPDLIAQGPDAENTWRKPLPEGRAVTLGRLSPNADWETAWDREISRSHVELLWQHGQLKVVKVRKALNQVFFKGQPLDEFVMAVGDQFTIGRTTFLLEDPEQPSFHEYTCSPEELTKAGFVDAQDRIEILAKLPAMIRYAPTEEELYKSALEVILLGIPRARAAALVWMNPKAKGGERELRVCFALGHDGPIAPADFKPSRKLVGQALFRSRQPFLHCWSGGLAPFTVYAGADWAMCAPLPDEPEAGFALYLAGAYPAPPSDLGSEPALKDLQNSDLKFAGLAADILGALRQARVLQKRLGILQSMVSPALWRALCTKNLDELLEPKEHAVTVLFCDLRGSCRVAEEGEQDLLNVWQRLSKALGIMTRNILDKEGIIGDFQGDAALGFWGWPKQHADQVLMAARAALAIQKEFHQASQIPGDPLADFTCGIGIAHGQAVAGRLGTLDQCKVSVFGPVNNLAARLESMTKFWQVPILLDEEAAAELNRLGEDSAVGANYRLRRLARVQPYGMTKGFLLYALLPYEPDPDGLTNTQLVDYDAALDYFLAGDWRQAAEKLEAIVGDHPTKVLQDYMAKNAGRPPRDWRGVIALASK